MHGRYAEVTVFHSSSVSLTELMQLRRVCLEMSQCSQASFGVSADRLRVFQAKQVPLDFRSEVEQVHELRDPCSAQSVPFGKLASTVNHFSFEQISKLKSEMNWMKRWLISIL